MATAVGDPVETVWQREVRDELRALVEGQRRIIALLEQHRPPSHPTREDRERLSAVLPVVAACLGSEPILTRDVLEDDAPALRLVLKGISARSLPMAVTLRTGFFQANTVSWS